MLCFSFHGDEEPFEGVISNNTRHGVTGQETILYTDTFFFKLQDHLLVVKFYAHSVGNETSTKRVIFFRENYVCQITSHEFAVMYLKKNDTAKVRHSFTHDSCAGRGDSLR